MKIAEYFSLFIKMVAVIFASIIAFYVIYFAFLNFNYYVATGSVDAAKIAAKADARNNPSMCGKIKTPPFPFFLSGFDTTEEDIIIECYYRAAKLMENEKVCEMMTEKYPDAIISKDICISDVAQLKNDPSVCSKISGQLQMGACYGNFTRNGANPSICENVSSESGTQLSGKDYCYINAVLYRPDLSICDKKIKSQKYRDDCYIAMAKATKNASICEKISGNKNPVYDDTAYLIEECLKNATN